MLVLDKQSPHLANFSIDRDKIQFFEKASVIVDKLQNSEKYRNKVLTQRIQEMKDKQATLLETV
jgi:hypothetical protein